MKSRRSGTELSVRSNGSTRCVQKLKSVFFAAKKVTPAQSANDSCRAFVLDIEAPSRALQPRKLT